MIASQMPMTVTKDIESFDADNGHYLSFAIISSALVGCGATCGPLTGITLSVPSRKISTLTV
jgi:hypothetical protein